MGEEADQAKELVKEKEEPSTGCTSVLVLQTTPLKESAEERRIRMRSGMIETARGFYAGDTDEGIPQGHGTEEFPDGRVYTGNFRSGKHCGWGQMVWPNGDSYNGEWFQDVIDGKVSSY